MASQNAFSSSYYRQVMLSYSYVGLWILLSFSVIVYNKYIMDPRLYNWPYPISLTMIHMAFCSAVAFVLINGFKICEPVEMTWKQYVTSVVPIGALYSFSLWFANSAYIYLSVSFIQMLKALMPVLVYGIGVFMKKETFKSTTMTNMVLITFGVGIAAFGEAKFNTTGILLQLSALLFEATRLMLIQILLTSKGIKFNPITSLYYISPACFVFLTIPWIFVELPKLRMLEVIVPDFFTFTTNSLCALGLNLAVFLLIGKTSALTMNVAGVVKDWILIAFSWSVIKDRVTLINLLGYLLAFAGVAWYNNAKLEEMKKASEAKEGDSKEETDKLLSAQDPENQPEK